MAPAIYRAGGFYEAPALQETLSHGRSRAVAELFPAYEYTRGLPEPVGIADATFADSLLALYRDLETNTHRGAASVLTELDDVSLANDVLYLDVDGEPRIVHETHRPNDRPYTALVGPTRLRLDGLLHRVADDRPHLYLGSVGSSNYGHWLVDDLPRTRAVAALQALRPGEDLVLVLARHDRIIDHVRAQSLRRILGGEVRYRLRFVERGRVHRFARLYYATPVSYHPAVKSPEAAAYLRAATATTAFDARPRRIFVTRRSQRGRVLIDAERLREELARRGFGIVDPEGMSFSEQVAAFSAAELVVGGMGAAMTNTVFCRAGATVVYLAPEGWAEPFYWDLAAICGHAYRVCYGATAPSDTPAHQRAFRIPVETITALL